MKNVLNTITSSLLLGIGYVALQKAKAEPELRELGLKFAANLQVALGGQRAPELNEESLALAKDLTTLEERLGPFMMRNLVRGLALEAVEDPAGLMSSVRHIPRLKPHLSGTSE